MSEKPSHVRMLWGVLWSFAACGILLAFASINAVAVTLGVLALAMMTWMVLPFLWEIGAGTEGEAATKPKPYGAVYAMHITDLNGTWHQMEYTLQAASGPPPREGTCEMCGVEYPVWSADNDLWNAVMRGGDQGAADEWDFVCPTCFTVKAEAMGVETNFRLSSAIRVFEDAHNRPAALPTDEG